MSAFTPVGSKHKIFDVKSYSALRDFGKSEDLEEEENVPVKNYTTLTQSRPTSRPTSSSGIRRTGAPQAQKLADRPKTAASIGSNQSAPPMKSGLSPQFKMSMARTRNRYRLVRHSQSYCDESLFGSSKRGKPQQEDPVWNPPWVKQDSRKNILTFDGVLNRHTPPAFEVTGTRNLPTTQPKPVWK